MSASASRQAQRLVKELIDGVAYLHRRGIAHRDLKPENILLVYNSASLQSVTANTTSKSSMAAKKSSNKNSAHTRVSHAEYSIKIVDFGFADRLRAGKGGLNSSFGSPWYITIDSSLRCDACVPLLSVSLSFDDTGTWRQKFWSTKFMGLPSTCTCLFWV